MRTPNKFLFIYLLLIATSWARSLEMREGDATPLPEAKAQMKKKDCGKIDLTKKMAPVHNQLGASCYAVAASDLINYGQQPKQYSALHLAQTYEQASGGYSSSSNPLGAIEGLNAGNLHEALENGISKGVCPESVIPSIDKKNLNTQLYEGIVEYYREADTLGCRQYDMTQMESVYGLSYEMEKKVAAWKNLRELIEKAYPEFDSTKLEEIYKDTSIDAFFRSVAQETCKNKLVKFKNKKVKYQNILNYGDDGKWYFDPDERAKLLAHVNETLARQGPVGITFESGGLIENEGPSVGAHSGTIAGRRWVEATKNQPAGCYFLVKNSWSTDWKVPAGLKAKSVSNQPGYFLMSEQSFLEHVHGTTSLE